MEGGYSVGWVLGSNWKGGLKALTFMEKENPFQSGENEVTRDWMSSIDPIATSALSSYMNRGTNSPLRLSAPLSCNYWDQANQKDLFLCTTFPVPRVFRWLHSQTQKDLLADMLVKIPFASSDRKCFQTVLIKVVWFCVLQDENLRTWSGFEHCEL